ncbi:hypothetical protein CHS0354_022502 [Potamilus streckersoni]|uniref:Uncharacterized protein n=1 Tax=Potamilus streckersoni TaxID=2493646 RepID=A0AAE0T1E4_9BIVA|nr:hypothetical protein CHS0354_022502 [Potamilus streckersoni]
MASSKKRIRESDLMKKCCRVGEEIYDFSKIIDLKGVSGRDATKKGRPQGVTSCIPSKTEVIPFALTLPDAVTCETETMVGDSMMERLLTLDETYSNLLKESDGHD